MTLSVIRFIILAELPALFAASQPSRAGDPATVYSVCEVLDQLASLNRRMISVRGVVISGAHGEFLVGRCGSKLKVRGFTWPDVIYLASPHSGVLFETDAKAYERVRNTVRRLRPRESDEVVMTYAGMLETEDLAKLTLLNRLNQPIGNGFGPDNVAPAQLVVKTVMNPRIVRGSGRSIAGPPRDSERERNTRPK